MEKRLLEVLLATRNALVVLGRSCPMRTKAIEEADLLLAGYPPFEEQEASIERMRQEAIEGGYWNEDTLGG